MAGLVSTAIQNQNDVKAAPNPVPTVSNPTVQNLSGDDAKRVIRSSKAYYDTFNPNSPGSQVSSFSNTEQGFNQNKSNQSAITPTPAPTVAPVQPLAPVQVGSQGYNPATWEVSPEQTVQGQIGNITRSGSPLMVQAETAGKQRAQRAGLLNSSLGISAAESSLYGAALPIASSDASTYATAAQSNIAAKNRASEFGAAAANTAGLSSAQLTSQQNLQAMQDQTQKEIAQLNANTQLSQTDKQLASQQLIANIQSNTQLSVTDKQILSAQTIAGMNADLQTKLQMIQSNTQLSVADKQAISNQVIAAQDVLARQKVAELNADTQKVVSKLSSDTQLAIANLDSTTKEKLQNIVSNNSQLLQASTSAANVMAQYMQSIANVQTSQNMNEGAKQKASDNLLNIMNSQLKAVGDIAGLDLSKYFQPVKTEEAPTTNNMNPRVGSEFDYLNMP